MPDDERTHNFRDQQEGLHPHERGTQADDSLSARTLTVALFVALGVLVVLLVLLIR